MKPFWPLVLFLVAAGALMFLGYKTTELTGEKTANNPAPPVQQPVRKTGTLIKTSKNGKIKIEGVQKRQVNGHEEITIKNLSYTCAGANCDLSQVTGTLEKIVNSI